MTPTPPAAIGLAYRSLHPDRTAPAVEAAEEARTAALDAAQTHADTMFGPDTVTASGFFRYDRGFHVTGWTPTRRREDLTLPPGTRYGRDGIVVPALRTPEGKALRAAAATFDYPLIDGLGGIVWGTKGEAHYTTGWRFRVLRTPGGAAVYATLSIETIDGDPPDPDLWLHVRPSAFHADWEHHHDTEGARP